MERLHGVNERLRVAVLVSKRGTILRRLLESKSYDVVAIFTDSKDSEATEIGSYHNIPVIVNDIDDFYAGRPKSDMQLRKEFDAETAKSLSTFKPDILAFAGYMHVATAPLIDSFTCINFHPADLTILNPDGTRKYTGRDAVKRAILAGEEFIRSSVILVDRGLDTGKVLFLSKCLKISSKSDDKGVERLLEESECLSKALSAIAAGRFSELITNRVEE